LKTPDSPPDFAAWWDAILTVSPAGPDHPDHLAAPPAPSPFPRLFGGHVSAQCLLAAAATVEPDRLPHSLHVSYLRGGAHERGVDYYITRIRDSRTLSTRLVSAEQDGRALASATVSFQVPGEAFEHEARVADPAPAPESLTSRRDGLASAFGDAIPIAAGQDLPVDMRYVDQAPWALPAQGAPARNRLWMRIPTALPDGAAVHATALTFATDFPMFEPVLFPGGMDWQRMISGDGVYGASLDHSLWFHRPARLDEWVLLEMFSPIATRSRGLCRAEAHVPGVGLVATVVQEMAWVESSRAPLGTTGS
jgi:acyl-CoA thioesterase-2